MGSGTAKLVIFLVIVALIVFIINGVSQWGAKPSSSVQAGQSQGNSQSQGNFNSPGNMTVDTPTPTPTRAILVSHTTTSSGSSSANPTGVRDETGKGNSVSWGVSLGPGDALIGQSFGFENATGGCQVFAVNGPYSGSVTITDGEWWTYNNGDVTSGWEQQRIQQLEQQQAQEDSCSTSNVTTLGG